MRRELHDGLVLRSISEGMVSDRENLAAFGEMAFSEGNDEPDEFIGGWIRSLLQPDHPAMSGDDIWVVADPAKDEQIVSMLLLIPQLWRYESVKIPVGRVEIVATHPDYRRRGLIRELMQVAHERSAALGHHVQAITGIPHFYRQFGYTMAVDLGAFATVPLATIPKLKDDQQPQFTVRPATEADIPKLVAWDAYHGDQMLLSTVRSEAEWRYELARHREHIWWLDVLIVTAQDGREVGYIALRRKFDHWLPCLAWIIGPESSYVETFEDVLRGIQAHVQEQYADSPPAFINFGGGMHDALHTMIGALYPGIVREHSYAWYLRAASPAQLMRDLAPVLEKRLQNSGANGYSGTLMIRFFDMKALRLRFEQGRLTDAQDEVADSTEVDNEAEVGLPWNTFLNIVFGYRTLDEIEHILPETYANGKARVLLNVLFPRKHSWVMPLA